MITDLILEDENEYEDYEDLENEMLSKKNSEDNIRLRLLSANVQNAQKQKTS